MNNTFYTAVCATVNLFLFVVACSANAEVAAPSTAAAHSPGDSDLWPALRAEFQLSNVPVDPRVLEEIRWLKEHPRYLQRVTRRAEPYLHYVLQEMKARGLPGELALLPVVESAYDPFAYSPGRAAGLWQFIPSTGKYHGLQQNWWHDERRDIVASTQAAIDYLTQAQARFNGDWLLALASYNAGQGRVSQALRKNRKAGKPVDFWSLSLPSETARYVPRLLAVSAVIEQPHIYGVALHPVSNEPQFEQVDIGAQLDLAQAAALAGIDMDELYRFNPQYNQWATPPDGPHRLLLPLSRSQQFSSALASLDPDDRLNWQRYTVKQGDTLSGIFKKFGITARQIKVANNLSGDRIRIGQALMIPVASENSSHYVMSAEQRNKRLLSSNKQGKQASYYVVRSGDSWWTIARKFSVSTGQLAKWNGKAPGDVIRPGQKLVIWSKSADQRVASGFSRQPVLRKVSYKVRSGDNLSRIASRFNVRLSDLVTWNNLDIGRYLKPGQNLRIHVNVTRG